MNTITVQQLIDALNKVEDKSLPVNTEQFCYEEDGTLTTSTNRILSVYQRNFCVRGRDYMSISTGILLSTRTHAKNLVDPTPLHNTPAHKFLQDLTVLIHAYEKHLKDTPIAKHLDDIQNTSLLITDEILPAHPRHA